VRLLLSVRGRAETEKKATGSLGIREPAGDIARALHTVLMPRDICY
jgi:hypothetical protein